MRYSRDLSLRGFSACSFSAYGQKRVSQAAEQRTHGKSSLWCTKNVARSLASCIQLSFPVCSTLPLKQTDASCHGCQEKSAISTPDEILWPGTDTIGQNSSSLTTKPSIFDRTAAPFLSILSPSLPVKSTTLFLDHPRLTYLPL